jgi:chitinase
MTYDYRGAWDSAGPTNFHANLVGDPNTPDYNKPLTGPLPGANRYYNGKDSVEYLLAQGAPANKLLVGIPFYGRGWTGVANGTKNGVYQTATGPARGTYEAGIEDYKVLKTAPGTLFTHNATQATYK